MDDKPRGERAEAVVDPIRKDDPAQKPRDVPSALRPRNEKDKGPALSEEDKHKKEEIDLLATRLQDVDPQIAHQALKMLQTEVRTATGMMTTVPKALKFLRPHYDALVKHFRAVTGLTEIGGPAAPTSDAAGSEKGAGATSRAAPMEIEGKSASSGRNVLPEAVAENAKLLADLLSVVAMTKHTATRDCLKFKLEGHRSDVGEWGHEYSRNLCGEIVAEWQEGTIDKVALMEMVNYLVPFFVEHNAEPEACDLLVEVEKLPLILKHVSEHNYGRISLYLLSFSQYVPEPEDRAILEVVHQIYLSQKQYVDALRLAIRMDSMSLIQQSLQAEDPSVRLQMAYLLGRQDLVMPESAGLSGEIADKVCNLHLSESYRALAEDLDVLEPRTPEDIYKTQLDETRSVGVQVDSARQNLASTFVNAFVNAGFGTDPLMTGDGNKWIFKNKDHGMMSAAASLGMILQWDVDQGLSQIDSLLEYTKEDYIKGGALLAVGMVTSGVRHPVDPAMALLVDYVHHSSPILRVGAILGLGLAYAGSRRPDVRDVLIPVVETAGGSAGMPSTPSTPVSGSAGLAALTPFDVACVAALSLGLVDMGSSCEQSQDAMLALLMEDSSAKWSTYLRFLCLGLGLLHLCRGDESKLAVEVVRARTLYGMPTIVGCAYMGTGNVIQIQQLLHLIAESLGEGTPAAASASSSAEGSSSAASSSSSSSASPSSSSSSSSAPAGGASGSTSASGSASGAVPPSTPGSSPLGSNVLTPVSSGPSARTNANASSESGAASSSSSSSASANANAKDEDRPHLGAAVLSIAMISMGEELSREMSRRSFEHLLQYGSPAVRRAVPLALALTHVSNPDVSVTDTLSKLSHDSVSEVASGAILGLGFIGAGTNNSRIGGSLRGLAAYYYKDPSQLFMVRLAQGLLHMGKGLVSLSPVQSDGLLMNRVAVAGLAAVFHSLLDLKEFALGNSHYMLFCLAAAMRPRMLMTLSEKGEILNVPVRVGRAVDTVGQAGKPKTITGFQTHTTPVLLGHGERAELASEDYIALTAVVENFVILRVNPNAPEKTLETKKAEQELAKRREEAKRKAVERREKARQDQLTASQALANSGSSIPPPSTPSSSSSSAAGSSTPMDKQP